MRKTITQFAAALLFALGLTTNAYADGRGNAGRDIAAPPTHEAAVVHQPAPQGRTGQISLQSGQLSLNVPHGWKFYSAEEAYAFLQRTGSAAPSGNVLGLLARDGMNPREANAWATVVSYDEIGYVQPETASGLTDASFEQTVRDARRSQSRTFEGFAAQPAFETTLPTLAWAERQGAPGTGSGADLRMEKRFLGRKGVATLTTIGAADQQDAMQKANDDLTPALTFAAGYRQADFQPSSDQVSTYSVPGLITGVPTPAATPQAAADTTATQTSFGGLAGMFPWIALGVIALAGVGFMATRRKKPEDDAA